MFQQKGATEAVSRHRCVCVRACAFVLVHMCGKTHTQHVTYAEMVQRKSADKAVPRDRSLFSKPRQGLDSIETT